MASIGKVTARAIGMVVAASMLCLAVAGTTLAGRTGSSAGSCQHDGWMVGQTSWGAEFNSKDACLFYVMLGGTVYKPSFTFDQTAVPLNTDAWMHVTGFHKNSKGTLTQHVLGGSGSTFSFLNVPTDANGNMAVISTAFTGTACADGAYGSEWTFTDEFGVRAGATVSLICRG